MNFGVMIAQQRREHGLNVSEAAEKTGVDAGTISRVENEKTQVTLATAVRLCEGLEISFSELLYLWQEKTFTDIPHPKKIEEQTALTIDDIQLFVVYWRRNELESSLWLADLLNMIVMARGTVHRIFTPEDIEKLVLLEDSVYRFEVQYPPHMTAEDIEYLYYQGGVLTGYDVGVYLRQMRQRRQLALEQLEDAVQISTSVLSRLETGAVERIKLKEIALLDETLKLDGKVLAMYWEAARLNELFVRPQGVLREMTPSSLTQQEITIVSVFITICRWLQKVHSDDAWVKEVRLRLHQGPMLKNEEYRKQEVMRE